MIIHTKDFFASIRKLRESSGMSQTELESAAWLPKWTVSRIERWATFPSMRTLVRIVKALRPALPPGSVMMEIDGFPKVNAERFDKKRKTDKLDHA